MEPVLLDVRVFKKKSAPFDPAWTLDEWSETARNLQKKVIAAHIMDGRSRGLGGPYVTLLKKDGHCRITYTPEPYYTADETLQGPGPGETDALLSAARKVNADYEYTHSIWYGFALGCVTLHAETRCTPRRAIFSIDGPHLSIAHEVTDKRRLYLEDGEQPIPGSVVPLGDRFVQRHGGTA